MYFNSAGSYVYPKAVDANILYAGPCLSNASFTHVTSDDTIKMKTFFTGSRTNDWVRNFLHIRYDVTSAVTFSRLAFFQFGADHYNQNTNFGSFVFGSAADGSWPASTSVTRDCSNTFSYGDGKPYRQELTGEAPWYISMSPQLDTSLCTSMCIGDRGFILREYSAFLGGVQRNTPAISFFCDRLELSVPAAVGSTLQAGDWVEFKLEQVMLPRIGSDFAVALANTGSNTLTAQSATATTALMIANQARARLTITSQLGAIQSQYPIRICVGSSSTLDLVVYFRAAGSALGFVPIVICGLSTNTVGISQGLWVRFSGAAVFTKVFQGIYDSTDFWQTNYDTTTSTYELVFNIEIFADADLAFGVDPTPPPCISGQYSAAMGRGGGAWVSVTGVQCEPCPLGLFSGSSASSCSSMCPAGQYSSGGTAACARCSAGQYQPTASTATTCIACAAGTSSVDVGSLSSASCLSCTAGTYSAGSGASACLSCTAGQSSPPSSLTSVACATCDVGKYSTAGLDCTSCPAGQYQTSTGASICAGACPAGMSSAPSSVSSADCFSCSAGFYAATSGSACSSCPSGMYQTATGATSCVSYVSNGGFENDCTTATFNYQVI